MPASNRSRSALIVLVAVIAAACAGPIVSPLPSTATAAPAASTPPVTSNSPTPSSSTTSVASASPASVAPSPSNTSPATSLKGQIVFEDDPQGGQLSQVWIENADGSDVRKVVSDAFTDFAASPSPDGRTILFYRVAPPPSQVPGVMMIVNVDGSGLHEVKVGDQARGCDDGPEGDSWSPDGKRIVYVRFCLNRAGDVVESGIWTIRSDGTNAQRVTDHLPADHAEDHRAGWSPDGKSLMFERIDTFVTPERAAIFTIGTDGKNLHQVTPWSLDGNDPDWSPDGSLIAFNASAEPSPTQNIYTIHPDGTGLAKLTTYEEPKQATYHPTWSPDGAHILFSHAPSTGGWADFYVMDADGGNQFALAHTELHENHGTWGPSVRP